MALKKFKPNTPGQRGLVLIDRSGLWKGKPEKSLSEGLRNKGGRNNHGRITARRRGGGHKRRYRAIDFTRDKKRVPGRVETIEYDPNRSAREALICYLDGERRYILAPDMLRVGGRIVSGDQDIDIQPGNSLPLRHIPTGTLVHNVEMKAGKGGQIVRSAGASAQVMAKEGFYTLLKLPSGELRNVRSECRATIGEVGNSDYGNVTYGKAGRSRWRGRRPVTRGVAMNPVDHPHGGGEGRSKGNHPQTPWGKPTKGYRTRGVKPSDKNIVKRRKGR